MEVPVKLLGTFLVAEQTRPDRAFPLGIATLRDRDRARDRAAQGALCSNLKGPEARNLRRYPNAYPGRNRLDF
jgi:hypothetical protein